ncbi:MAG TPA: Ppx/GppA phosphatase family protein [Methyloceanibacter sp.]|nr:Ppx/GppA phosphatase family protein [Methyloceanibacter sp.]
MSGPSGNARPAAVLSPDPAVARKETGDCGGRGGPAQVASRARAIAPANGLFGAAGGKKEASAPRRARAPATYGALDLGTNNCRLLIAKPSRRGFLVIDAFSRIIRLGEGVLSTGRLSEAAMSRTIDALKVCAEKLHRRGVTRSRLIATEACRIAANAGEFIERARRETGLSIEIVTQETEARLAVSGCASLIDRSCDYALVFDIGGGSSELIWLDLARLGRPWRRSLYDRIDMQNCITAWTSLPIGVVNLAERHGGRNVTPESYEAMVQDVISGIAAFEAEHRFGDKIASQRAHFLGTSGTVTTISGVHLKLPVYERAKVDGCWLSARDVRNVSSDLIAMSYAERVAQPCIGQERADLVLAGCAILEALLRIWPCQRLRVADRGLREGILATLMAEDGHNRRAAGGGRASRPSQSLG